MGALKTAAKATPTDATVVFRENLESIMPSLRIFAQKLCRDRAMVDDLVQETALRAWSARNSFQPGTNFRAWVYTILQNNFYTTVRKNGRMVSWDPATAERILIQQPPQQHVIHMTDAGKALQKLPAEQREILMLIGANGATYEEAAEIVGCPMGTVKSRLARGRIALGAALDGQPEISNMAG